MGDPIQQFYQWFMSKSLVSKLYFMSSIVLFILTYFGFLTIEDVFISWDKLSHLELWRLFTALFYEHSYSIFEYPFKLYVSYSIIVNFEEKVFGKQKPEIYAEFLWLVFIVWIYVTALTLLLDFYVTNNFFFLCLCFVWAKKNPNSRLSLVFGLNVPVEYLPYIYSVYSFIFSIVGFWQQLIAAFGFSYLYYYLRIYHMTKYQRSLFPAPKLFELMVSKYLILEKRFGIVRQYQEQIQINDPYAQYGRYSQ